MNRAITSNIISSFWLIGSLFGFVISAYFFRNILLLIFLAFIFAAALYPAVRFGKKFKIPVSISLTLMYVFVFLFLSLLLSFVIPPLVRETAQFANVASQMIGLQQIHFDGMVAIDFKMLADSYKEYGSLLNQFTGSIQAAITVVTSTFSLMFVLVTWLVMTSHIILSLNHLAAAFSWLLPGEGNREEKAKRSRELLETVLFRLGGWVRGQLVLMFAVGIVTYIGLLFLGVPFALPLAIIAGFLELVPNLGPTLSAVPAVLAAFILVNPLTGFMTILFYVLVQLIENSFLVPQIMRGSADVHPLTTLVLMLIGFQSMGALGAIGILPLYIVVRTLARELVPNKGPFADTAKYLPQD